MDKWWFMVMKKRISGIYQKIRRKKIAMKTYISNKINSQIIPKIITNFKRGILYVLVFVLLLHIALFFVIHFNSNWAVRFNGYHVKIYMWASTVVNNIMANDYECKIYLIKIILVVILLMFGSIFIKRILVSAEKLVTAVVQILINVLSIYIAALIIGCMCVMTLIISLRLLGFFGVLIPTQLKDMASSLLDSNMSILHDLSNIIQNVIQIDILPLKEDITNNVFTLLILAVSLLIGMFIIGVFKHEASIVVLPFEVGAGYKGYNGNAISDMLTTGLKRIRKIHSAKYDGIKEPNKLLPTVVPPGENLSYNIAELGTIGKGLTSISLGLFIITLKRLCPGVSPGCFITGSIQEYGSKTTLVAHMEGEKGYSWRIQRDNAPHKQVPDLVRELSFKIAQDSHEDMANTWQGFKYFTEALDYYGQYNKTKHMKYLKKARMSALKAANAENGYSKATDVLYNIGIAYLYKKGGYSDAERLFRQLAILKPDDYKALLGWGMALRLLLCLDEQAITCYDMVLKNDPKCAEAYCMKAISLRNRKEYDNAIKCFDKALKIKPDYAFALQYKGSALEAIAATKDKSKLEEAIQCYEDALELDPELKLCQPSMVRLSKFHKKVYCNNVRATIWKENEYDQACYHAICENNPKKALDLLEIALKELQVTRSWAQDDPDLESIHGDPRFKKMLENYPKYSVDPEVRIAKIAIYRKLGPQDKIEEQIENARELVKDENEYIQARYYAVCYDVKRRLDDVENNDIEDNPKSNVEYNAKEALWLLETALEKELVTPDEARFDPDFEFIRENPRFEERFHQLIDKFSKDN